VERDQQAVIGAAVERARVARELHDIVAHSLLVIVRQADGGRYAATADPAAARTALDTIAETGREALTEMRRLLGVLRVGAEESYAPPPGAAELSELVRQIAAPACPSRSTPPGQRSDPAAVAGRDRG
jgi:signal transduction histidine kinase